MSSPFPGMDPYLEDNSFWPDVHQRLINYISEALQPQVRPKYLARIGEHIELNELRKGYFPDILIVQPPRNPAPTIGYTGTLVADAPQILTFLEEEQHVPYIELIYRETGDIVTLIEVLSPSNKVGVGRAQYLQKQIDLLSTQVNLVEIDLLRLGQGVTLGRAIQSTHPDEWHYVVSVNRVNYRNSVEVYAFGLKERLPRCRIPLRPADGDVVLDLPAVFNRCYEAGGYDLMIDYAQEPPVALSETEMQWVRTHLQQIKVATTVERK